MPALRQAHFILHPRRVANGVAVRVLTGCAAALIAVMLTLGLHRLFVTNVNWDEFYYLSLVHLYRVGDLTNPLQTAHVYFFTWLPWVSVSEVQQIFAARAVVWLVSLATSWFIYAIARRFCRRLGALLAAILYLSFTFVVDHGLSFRADPFCALLFLISVHALVNLPERWFAPPLAALALAAAALVSIKSVFFLPTVVSLLAAPLLNGRDWQTPLRRMAIVACGFIVAFTGLLFWHRLNLAPVPLADAGTYAVNAGSKTMVLDDSVPAWPYVRQALADNALTWIFIVFGLWIAIRRLGAGQGRAESIQLLSLALPLLSLLVYRNAFAYFFVFLMPAAVIPGALAADTLAARAGGRSSGVAVVALAATLALTAAAYGVRHAGKLPDQTVAQAEVVNAVHAMFSKPVPYIDRNSMIATFPKVGFFMSTWGLEAYRAAGRPIMADVLAQHAPPFLLANHPALNLARPWSAARARNPYDLLAEDYHVLQANYVPHWGIVYVAGMRIAFASGAESKTFEILIPGTYTLEATTALRIDGSLREPGSTVSLTRGVHQVAAPVAGAGEATLRWGNNLFRPSRPPSPRPIYTGF